MAFNDKDLRSQWSCLREDFPTYGVLKIAWCAKITLLIIKFSRRINQIPDFQELQTPVGSMAQWLAEFVAWTKLTHVWPG